MNEHAEDVINQVIEHWAGHISTHYAGCWKMHASCLAHLIRDLENDDDD